MIIVEAARSPIIINEETENLMFYKAKTKKFKEYIKDILAGKARIKDPEKQEELNEYILKNEDTIKKLYNAINDDMRVYIEDDNALKALIVPMVASIAGTVAGGVAVGKESMPAAIVSWILAVIGYISSTIILSIKVDKESGNIDKGVNSLRIIKKELNKIDPKKIKDKKVREKYESLLSDVDDLISRYDAIISTKVKVEK